MGLLWPNNWLANTGDKPVHSYFINSLLPKISTLDKLFLQKWLVYELSITLAKIELIDFLYFNLANAF